jgi:hypothetical protein
MLMSMLGGWGYFPKSTDRFQVELAMENLKVLWINFQRVGASRLIISDVIEERKQLERYQQAVSGAQILVVRLAASLGELERRLKNREAGLGLARHLERTAELAVKLEQARVEDFVVHTEGKDVPAVAREVLARCGWMESASAFLQGVKHPLA